MARNKPDYRLTHHDEHNGTRKTVGRYTTGDAVTKSRLDKRQQLPTGSSDYYTVHQIKHRR